MLEFVRDEEVEGVTDTFQKEKNKLRKVLLGSCKMLDSKMEKNGAYEFTPSVSILLLSIIRIRKMRSTSSATR